MDSKITRFCDGLLEAGWLAAVIATPLFFNIHSSRVFEPDKLTLLRSIALLMVVAWLVKFIDQRAWQSLSWLSWRSEKSVWRMPFVLPIALLVVIYLLSTVFSVTRSVSWAGSYQRLQGTYTTLSYLVIFCLMVATIRSRAQVSRVVTAVIVTSIPVALYAMLQHFGLDPLPWGGNVQRRVAGHMGNSIFIAAYLIMAIPLTFGRIIDAFTNILNDEELSQADVIRSSIYIFALAIQFIAIFWSRSRGPFLGLAASIYAFVLIMLVTLRNAQHEDRRFSWGDAGRALLLVGLGTVVPFLLATLVLEGRTSALVSFGAFVGSILLLIVAIFVLAVARRGWRWLWLSWILLAFVLAGFLGLFNVPSESAEAYLDTPLVGDVLDALGSWRELPEIGRFGQLLESEEGSGRVRVLIWEGVLDLISLHPPLEFPDGSQDAFNFLRPIIGYGPESMYVAYNGFYPPELATIEARNASPDRSHNETFDALVITGGAGLLVWQILYLSVFYYCFGWLGVVRGKRDRNVLIGLWVGGGIAGSLIITALLGMPFLGVALPFGSIIGLILYLIYYALVARGQGGESEVNPFDRDRLLLIALVAAVLAHYVEIHFGIAIAATRTHFFVYLALMFMIGYYLPKKAQAGEEVVVEEEVRGRRRRRVRSSTTADGWAAPVLSFALMLGLMVGILGYNFMTYSLPEGETIQTIDDVPSAGEIFHQSLFVNAGSAFAESPFVFLMISLTWLLGSLAVLSELAKEETINFRVFSARLDAGRARVAGLIFVALLVASLAFRFFLFVPETVGLNRLVGNGLLLVWAALSLWAAVVLLIGHPSARVTAGLIGLAGFILSIPVVAAGATLFGFILAISCGVVIYMLWDVTWNDSLLPVALVALISIVAGLFFAYVQAFQIRAGILPPPGLTAETPDLERRILEANQSMNLLTVFYFFILAILLFAGLTLARMGRLPAWNYAGGLVAVIMLFPLAFYFIASSNMRIVQADIVYKRADPWDKQAGRSGNPELWANAATIYERAIELAPREDFYFLWLGRALLEQSGVTQDEAVKASLLAKAEERLQRAQEINPLNTDHTANLARLHTRWAEFSRGDERQGHVGAAASYYESAMTLSPNNSIIANEYARLAYILLNDCQKSMEVYGHSVEVDPFYTNTLFDMAEVALACGKTEADEDQQLAYFEIAAETMTEALARQPGNVRRQLQMADIFIRLGQYDQALAAYDEAVARNSGAFTEWQIDFTMAQWFSEVGEQARAIEFARSALAGAPPEVSEQIEQFLAEQAAGGSE
jgi:tetratricopeptide (TPR) repeat protein